MQSGSAKSIVPPTTIVILGGTGNLAETKLLPALFDLFHRGVLPSQFHVVGLSRKDFTNTSYQTYVLQCLVKARPQSLPSEQAAFVRCLRYCRGDFDTVQTYEDLRVVLTTLDAEVGQCSNKLFYVAVPPTLYSVIFTQLSTSGVMALCEAEGAWSRLLVEKPFGRDLATAKALEEQVQTLFAEEQIYRIDHYLAKDAIENIIALRFSNRVLADSWHKGEVASIAIRILETNDVASRGSFYDGIGALRDVGQNHVLQILALLTMKPVAVADIAALRHARSEVLGSLCPPTSLIKAQYEGYRDTSGVAPDSQTETYFKIETTLSLPDWEEVPITLEAGKALGRAVAEAVITFKASDDTLPAKQNVLTFTFSPVARIALTVFVKRSGFGFVLEPRELELVHGTPTDDYSPEAYERVLFDCILGDQTRFVSNHEVLAAWQFITPLLETPAAELCSYPSGSLGPVGA